MDVTLANLPNDWPKTENMANITELLIRQEVLLAKWLMFFIAFVFG